MSDIKKSLSRLAEIAAELKKSNDDGHATIGNPMKTTKPMAAAKPPTMPIAKANVPSPGKSLPAAKTSVPAAKTTQPVKHIANPAKEKAYMKVQKSIVLVQKQIDPSTFKPISDDIIKKSFGSIPEIMKNMENRPHESWWNRGMERVNSFTDEPANYLGRIWYGDVSKEAPWGEENYSSRRDTVNEKSEEEDPDNEALKKWVSGALEGGGLSSLRGHPRAGNAIKNAATYIGKSVLGRSDKIFKSGIGDIDPEEIGSIVLDAIDEIVTASQDDKLQKAWAGTAAGLMTKSWQDNVQGDVQRAPAIENERPFVPVNKSVAEPLSSKNNPQKRKSKLGEEYDGESAVSGDGAKLQTKDLLEKNETIKEY